MQRIDEDAQARKKFVTGEWIWVFQKELRRLSQDRRLKWGHWRVLAYVMSCATFAQDISIRQQQVAEDLGMHVPRVSEILRDFHTMDILRKVPTGQLPATYRLNSRYIYKGHGEQLPQRRAYQRKERVHASQST